MLLLPKVHRFFGKNGQLLQVLIVGKIFRSLFFETTNKQVRSSEYLLHCLGTMLHTYTYVP